MLAMRPEPRDSAEFYMNYRSAIVTKSKDVVEKLRSYGFKITNTLTKEKEYFYIYEFTHPTLYAIVLIIVANDPHMRKEFGRKKDAENYMMDSDICVNFVKVIANYALPKELAKVVVDYIGCNRKQHYLIKVDLLENIRKHNAAIFPDILHYYVSSVIANPRQPDSDIIIDTITKYIDLDPNFADLRSKCIAQRLGLESCPHEINFTVEGVKRLRALIEADIEAKRQKISEVEIVATSKSDKEISE